jgi:ribosomal protein L11 methyltransferase
MRHKSLWKISVTTTLEAEDAVAELLNTILNQPATAYTDSETGICTVTVYLRQKPNLSREDREVILTGLKRIKQYGLRIGPGKIVVAKVRKEDWAESWKRHFKPIEIGDALLIKPSWSRRKSRKDQAVVMLDPGLSFGTGQHPTTAFCLHQIVRFLERKDERSNESDGSASRPYYKPPAFLDLGTGSGILAIAAAKLGYSPVLAMDLDPEAVRVARANARANGVLPKVKIRRRNVSKLPIRPRRPRHGYHLVCANLISDLLIAERRRIAGQLNPTGTLVLAGILRPEFRKVRKAYKTLGLRLISRRNDQEWCSGSFRFGP